jgi:hypothetical protein
MLEFYLGLRSASTYSQAQLRFLKRRLAVGLTIRLKKAKA